MTRPNMPNSLSSSTKSCGSSPGDIPGPESPQHGGRASLRAPPRYQRASLSVSFGNRWEGKDDVLFDASHAQRAHEARGLFVGHWSLLFWKCAHHARLGGCASMGLTYEYSLGSDSGARQRAPARTEPDGLTKKGQPGFAGRSLFNVPGVERSAIRSARSPCRLPQRRTCSCSCRGHPRMRCQLQCATRRSHRLHWPR